MKVRRIGGIVASQIYFPTRERTLQEATMNHAGWCTTDMAPCAATVPSVCPIENSGTTHHLVSPSSSRFLGLDFNNSTFDSHFPLLSDLCSSWNHPPWPIREHPTRRSLVTSALALAPLLSAPAWPRREHPFVIRLHELWPTISFHGVHQFLH